MYLFGAYFANVADFFGNFGFGHFFFRDAEKLEEANNVFVPPGLDGILEAFSVFSPAVVVDPFNFLEVVCELEDLPKLAVILGQEGELDGEVGDGFEVSVLI